MKIYAAGDLHLSLNQPYNEATFHPGCINKPMDIFGMHWDDYMARLKHNWQHTVADDDMVLIPGDISWAMTLAEAKHDLDFIGSLPGHKIISRGNHDYWWDGIGKLRAALPANMQALQHDAIALPRYAVCATRGWLLPDHNDFKESADRKIYERELLRLEFALTAASRLSLPIILMTHYPPVNNIELGSEFLDAILRYDVRYCVYGHIHGNKNPSFTGAYRNINFFNVSVDRLNFQPLLICE